MTGVRTPRNLTYMNTTTAKVAARIITATETATTFRAAVTAAAFEAAAEAKAAGWSERTIAGMMQTFANVATDMAVAAA